MARMSAPLSAERGLLSRLACPNEDCSAFNRFGGGNLSVVEWMGKRKDIRRLYCSHCGVRFSERRGTLYQYTKVPDAALQRILKCLNHGCSVTATADICDVDARTVQRILRKAGPRANDFHCLQLAQQRSPMPVAELDEVHGRVAAPKKKSRRRG